MLKRYLIILIVCLLIFGGTSAFGKEFITITTATTGGSFYPAGVALAVLLNEQLGDKLDISFSSQSSAGSVENIDILQKKEAEIAFIQNNVILWAYEGTRKYEGSPYEKLRTLTPLFSSQYHFFVSKEIDSLRDMRKKKFVVGRPGSGTETSSKLVLEALGLTYDDFKPEFLGQSEAADALRNGLVDGINMVGGFPIAAVSDLMATPSKRFKFLSLSDEEISTINKAEPWMSPVTIPAGTYLKQPEDIKTVGHNVYITTTVDMPEELAYQVVKTIFENLDWLEVSYGAWKKLSLDKVDGSYLNFIVPVHEGALKYYRELGIVK